MQAWLCRLCSLADVLALSPAAADLESKPSAGSPVMQGSEIQAQMRVRHSNIATPVPCLDRGSCSLQGLAALQPKMQAWLGRLGSWADALALGPVAADLQGQAISKRWDAKDMIGLKVSFPGMERADPVLWLDNLLPMVGHLRRCLEKTFCQ